MKENLEGRLTISRVSGGDDTRRIKITLEDKSSGCRVVEISVTLEDFALALTAMGHNPCTFDLNDSGFVGLKREHKTELVTVPGKSYDAKARRIQAIETAFKSFEVDGWRGRRGDCDNYHNQASHSDWDATYRVVFERWVDPVTGEPKS